MKILITGGCGFIGTAFAKSLMEGGHDVVAYDNFEPQVHGHAPKAPEWAVRGDVRDRTVLVPAVRRAEMVVHFAAVVGVGQSQYDIRRYVDANVTGTATLLDVLANERHSVQKLLVAGSMSSYGEGAYVCSEHGRMRVPPRRTASNGSWDPPCPTCGRSLRPVPTSESDVRMPTSVYAVSKSAQEDLALAFGAAHRMPVVVPRFFNVVGPGQSLSNPYTGVAAIFVNRVANGRPPLLYEDGLQSRDFVSVGDVVRACTLLLFDRRAEGVFNVGTGSPTTLLRLAETLCRLGGGNTSPKVLGSFRSGDVRHCFADMSKMERALGYVPSSSLEQTLIDLAGWSSGESVADRLEEAHGELVRRRLA